MKFSLTLVFFILFLAVAAAYVYLVPPSKNAAIEGSPEISKLLPLEENDEIVSLEVENAAQKEKIVFVREEGAWSLRQPVQGAADKILVDGLAAALTLSSKARRLTPEKGWAEYGLENPAVKVGIGTLKGGAMKHLFFGDKSPVGSSRFARWDGEKEYFLLDENLMKAFQRSAYSFREKKIFHMPLRDISKIKIQNESEVYELGKQESGWVWMEPIELIGKGISEEMLDTVVTAMRNLFIKDFLGAEADDSDKGFGELGPDTVLQITGINPGEMESLHLGDELPVRDAFYARKDGENGVFLVARDRVGEVFAFFRTMALKELSPAQTVAAAAPEAAASVTQGDAL